MVKNLPRCPSPGLDEFKLRLVEAKLAQTLDMLDVYGVSGVITVCLLPNGATYLTSGGSCADSLGAASGLLAGLMAIRDLAAAQGDSELQTRLTEAVRALAPAVGKARGQEELH